MSIRSSLWRTAVSVFVQEKHKNVSWYRNGVGTFTVNPHVSGCTTMHKSLRVSREDAYKTAKCSPLRRASVSGFRAREHETPRGFRK